MINVIANPWAGRGRGRRLTESFAAAAGGLGDDVAVHFTGSPGDGTRIARDLAATSRVVVIVGGDGTIHEVVQGLMPAPPPVIIVPAGTGNDFASLVSAPRTLAQVQTLLRDGYGARLDVLDTSAGYCVNSMGFGFEGIVNRYSHHIKHIHGPALYMAALVRALAAYQCPHFVLTTEDGTRIAKDMLLFSIGNGVSTGGAFYMTPDAYPDDGHLDICIVRAVGRLRMLTLLPRSLKGEHVRCPEVTMLRSESVTIDAPAGLPMHIDGELVDPMPVRFEARVIPHVLPVLMARDADVRVKHSLEKIL